MDLDLKESIDFDFFDERPGSQNNVTPSSPSTSASKPPVHPRSVKQLPKTDSVVNSNDNKFSIYDKRSESNWDNLSRENSPEHSSDSTSRSEKSNTFLHSHKNDDIESQSIYSSSSSIFSSSSLSGEERSNSSSNSLLNENCSDATKRNGPSGGSVIIDRPTNTLTNPEKQTVQGRYQHNKAEYNSSRHSDRNSNKAKKLINLKGHDNGDHNPVLENVEKRQAWGEVKVDREQEKRPKSAKVSETLPKSAKVSETLPKSAKVSETLRKDRSHATKLRRAKYSLKNPPPRPHSDSSSLSDSDITDVSPIETPRNGIENKYNDKANSNMTSAGDGHPVKIQFKSVTDVDQKKSVDQEYDPDIITGLDLKILMKAVGELEKDKKVNTNSRRVMFAPPTLNNFEKSNYTFDKNQARDIERENHRLLKEIVRHVSAGERQQLYGPHNLYRLTPSAVNRERDIQRIERENLAFLKRLQEVKPTKSICRAQQLRAYKSTIFHGVPIAALHHKPKGRRLENLAMDGSDISVDGHTHSVSSMTSIGSSVQSTGSSRSSQPSSTCRKPGSSIHVDRRPAWSDRW